MTTDSTSPYTRLRVADLLKARGITLQSLHALILRQNSGMTITYQTLHALVNGTTRNPSLDAIGAIKRALAISYGDLYEEIPTDSPVALAEKARQERSANATKRRRQQYEDRVDQETPEPAGNA